ncbi:MOSC domain-containing protein [Paenibacillus sp. FJAT-26967]|uniref:MOSC domain-containing protein n=1 Tax=Paenibacillus sp. FJAT-26967 TaxID=1729690 RepID=UPI000838F151|nr:MOSC domain-containing protein [Paenibacillus sp. FJAT-26967]
MAKANELGAVLSAVLIADQEGSFITRVLESAELQFGGLPGDRHFGVTSRADVRQSMYPRGTEIMNRRQISIVSEEECGQIAAALGIEKVLPQWLGANMAVSGLEKLTQLPAGSRILFPSGAGLICEGENEPCVFPGKVIAEHSDNPKLAAKFVKAAWKRRGIVASVECPGLVQPGETVRILLPSAT